MPTIAPVVRQVIGGTQEAQPTRTIIKSSATGMTPLTQPEPSKLGQNHVSEETTPPAVTLSPQLTALARKQQILQREVQAQRDKEAQFEKTKADYIPRSVLQAKASEDVNEALKEALGMTYEELTARLLEQSNGADPVKALEAKLNKLEESQTEAVNKQYDATLKQYKAETDSLVSSDPKSFFLINKGKHQDAVVQHIVDTWKEDDTKVLTVEQAAKEIEEFLRDEARASKALLEELEGPPAETPQEKKLPPPKAATRTLTQQVETAPTRTYNQFQHLSPKERLAQAIARATK